MIVKRNAHQAKVLHSTPRISFSCFNSYKRSCPLNSCDTKLTICLLLFMPSFSSRRSPSPHAGTRTPICSYSFSSNLICGYSANTFAPLYLHFLFSELEEPVKRPSIRSPPRGAHCCSVRYHRFSFLQCHTRAQELCVVFAQLLHLHAMTTSRA